ncbi:MAG: sulfate permease [Simkaniaceae bacterium]|nr:sulfate permease [Simkaniaceae bacterium]
MKRSRSFCHDFIPTSYLAFKQGYTAKCFRSDLFAGLTVGVIALPLAMAFAIASGVPPVTGLYTAIIAGFLVSLFGGSHFQITGPTGAFVIIIYTIIQEQGYNNLCLATLLAGVILLLAGLSKLGALIKFIPYPLVTGFTTGIAVMIFISQIKDFFGLSITTLPAHFIPKCLALFQSASTWHLPTTLVASLSLLLILLIRHFTPRIPWGITAITITTLICYFFQIPVDTIYSRFGEIPHTLPMPTFPHFDFVTTDWYLITQSAITIAFLAGIESLLSAVVADGMGGHSHKSSAELFAQGIGNIASILFGGIPSTGAIARTAMNIKSGAKSPLSGMIHAITLLLIMLFLSPLVSQIPLAALASVLVVVAWNMSEIHHFRHLFNAPRGDIAVLLTTFFLTIFVDLIVAIEIGMILAAFLFMKRVRDLSGVHSLTLIDAGEMKDVKSDPDAIEKKQIPPGVEVYEITGLFFFGLADTLNQILANCSPPPAVFILRLRKIPVIDASGMHGLREFYYRCQKHHTTLLLSGVQPKVASALHRFGISHLIGEEHIFTHIDASLQKAAELSAYSLSNK